MTGKHWALIAGCLIGIGGMSGALHDWHEAMNPSFVGGVCAVIGTQIGAIFAEKP